MLKSIENKTYINATAVAQSDGFDASLLNFTHVTSGASKLALALVNITRLRTALLGGKSS